MKLFYRELGEGQPIVILHGVFGSSDNWLTPAKVLSQNHKVYLIDQRNHGHSPKSDVFNNVVMADDLAEFMEEHFIADPIVIGHSMGGKVAMNYAKKHEENLKKLIVVDISPKYYPPHHQKILAGLNAIDLKQLKSRQDADEILKQFEPEIGVRQFLLKNLYRNEQGEFDWRINLPVISEKIENVGEALDESAKINIPTLFIRGEKSNYIKPENEEMIRRIFKNYKIVTVEGAGHWVQAEQPEKFLNAVQSFL
jgi:pimeloyl-ACP methyl ester carboxylesterase